jgi:hypothetical protein
MECRKDWRRILAESYGERNLDRFQQEIQAAEVPIFVLGFSGFNTGLIATPQIQRAALDVENQAFTKVAVRESVLEKIADATGGRAELLIGDSSRAVERIITAAEEIGAELRGQYLIGYYPKSVTDDGRAHVVRVQATSPRHTVRFRRLPLAMGK